jgi:tetratricopeptide (TPR) repeat protein
MLRARPPSREVSAALAVCHTLLAGVLGTIGRTDAALEHAAEAVRIAEALDQRVDLLTALWATGEVHAFARQWPDAIAALERARALCHDWEVTFLRPNIVGTLGYAYALSGRAEEGRRLLESALAEQEQRGWRFAHTLLMTRLGEAHLAAGDPGAAREWGERAVALARRQEERGYEALADQLLAEIKGITWRE